MFILTLINQTTRLPTQIIFTFCVLLFHSADPAILFKRDNLKINV